MVVSQAPHQPGFRRFWGALCNEAARINQTSDTHRRIHIFYGIDGHADSEDFQRLTSLVERQRLAGILFISSPYLLRGSLILERPGIARVSIAGGPEQFPGTTMIGLDTQSFMLKAADCLAARGRKRVAMMCVPGLHADCVDAFQKRVSDLSMTTRPYWNLRVEPSLGDAIREIAHLLMNPEQRVRPDALVIADDNLVEPVTAGLVAAGVSVPEDMDIVAHCNFPWNTPSHLPVERIGFDARQVLNACFNALDHQRDQGEPMAPISIDARHENDLPGELVSVPVQGKVAL
jgi:DNA-binding LacI/PurR family transcriptional regulator